jgi:hypothetical protein
MLLRDESGAVAEGTVAAGRQFLPFFEDFGLEVRRAIEKIREKYPRVYLIVAPPRSSSTALSRVFWQHRAIAAYCHEPFDVVYHQKRTRLEALEIILNTEWLGWVEKVVEDTGSLLIKEMSFQVGQNFSVLASLTTHPIVFQVRDPRVSIMSRMTRKQRDGRLEAFPSVETGWDDLVAQIGQCRRDKIPYVILDSADFRNGPSDTLRVLLPGLGLSFSEDLLQWCPMPGIPLGRLGEEQREWYTRVLSSDGIEAEAQPPPPMSVFPEEGFRRHVERCVEDYQWLLKDPHRLVPAAAVV